MCDLCYKRAVWRLMFTSIHFGYRTLMCMCDEHKEELADKLGYEVKSIW